MKEIQEWLGHSHFSTTANFYAHLDYDSKKDSANAINNVLLISNAGAGDNQREAKDGDYEDADKKRKAV